MVLSFATEPSSFVISTPDGVIATDLMATHWAFYFHGYGLPLSVSGSWSSSMCRAPIVLQELLAVAMILHRRAFYLSGKVGALHLDSSTVKAYLCNQGGVVSPFLSRQAGQILSLTNKHGIHLLPPYIPTHLKVDANYIHVPGSVASRVAASPSDGSSSFLPLGSTRGGSAVILPYHSMPALLHFVNSTTSVGLGVECLQPSLDISGKLCVSSFCISSSSSVKVSGRICHGSTQTFDAGGTILDGGSLASYSSEHMCRCSSALSHHKRSHHGCSSRPCAQGSATSSFNSLAAKGYVLYR